MTIYERHRKHWGEAAEASVTAWDRLRSYKKAVQFVRVEVPEMLAQLDADTKHINDLRTANKKLRDSLHAAGINPADVLSN